jgi:transglutaminase-like putative cysteine protease
MTTEQQPSGSSRQGAPAPYVPVPERPGFDRYLEDTIVVDWQTPTVFEKARTLVEGAEDELERVRRIFVFVRDEIRHSLDHGDDDVPCTASQVLRAGTGLCYAKSHLLAALLRARGIPAGFGYQRLRRDDGSGRFVLHGFVVAWLSEPDAWVVLDARGDTDTIHTEADPDAPSLAFTPDPEADESTSPIVYARPPRRIVDLLDQAESLARIRAHLPDSIGD